LFLFSVLFELGSHIWVLLLSVFIFHCNLSGFHALGWFGDLVRGNIYLYDVQIATCLVYAYENYNCFGEVIFFVVSKVSNGTNSSKYVLRKIRKTVLKRLKCWKVCTVKNV
jgi:hypothetical protein